MDSLVALKSFVCAAKTESFVAAGRQLGISASAVGKNIANLEEDLGVRLFQRSTRKIALTEEGGLLYERALSILSEIADARALLQRSAEEPSGRLRIRLPHVFYRLLMPVLSEFRRSYPAVELELDFDDGLYTYDHEFDATIQAGELDDSTFKSRKLGEFAMRICASPAYLDAHGTPVIPRDLSAHQAIQFRYRATGKLKAWVLSNGVAPAMATAVVCNNMEAVRGAAIEGLGVAYVPDFLVDDAIREGRLVPLLEDRRATPIPVTVLWPTSRFETPRLRAFINFAHERLAHSRPGP
ncbi:LysR family transcriptional regulator [Luteibacter sp. 3190]|uniref:LysR family transcriptional regulator n=1 Tax=Luteibacter sp. 3190 TaxID=2817736 RepID=UPI0028657917|nr:LysR family transcriptional regulator [Luteibacter sp. 3190]MDR6938214.1 DNA-binding transcriptional LysR family regulator [Luteibacter sp. 3190]